MNINGPKDLYHFLMGHGLQRLSPESQNFVNSMDVLARMCPCDPPAAKNAQAHAVQAQYINFAQKAPGMAQTLIQKSNGARLQFYVNGQMISSVGR